MQSLTSLHSAFESTSSTIPAIAARAGLSRSSVYRIFDGDVSPRLDDLEELFIACGLQLDLRVSPLHDLDAGRAARGLLADSRPDSLSPWATRLLRQSGGDPVRIFAEAGAAASVLNDPSAVGLRAARWDVDRLVSAGQASSTRWALSGWAALNAMGYESDAATIFWTDDVRLTAQLLADTMEQSPLAHADVIIAGGDESIFTGVSDLDDVPLVDTVQAFIDCIGLGGEAARLALDIVARAS